jgi:hypothetical protein
MSKSNTDKKSSTTSKIITEERDIAPDWSREILDRHYKRIAEGKLAQRPLTKSVVNRYASDMSTNNWLLTHQGIAFDTNDDLYDGQHRLEAVCKSGKTVRMLVTTGIPAGNNGETRVMDVVDCGKARSIDQMLHLHGLQYAKNYTSTMRFIARVAHLGVTPLMTFSAVKWMMDDLGLLENVAKIVSVSTDIRDFRGGVVGALAYYHTAFPKKAMQFAEDLFNYQGGKGSPVSLYLKWSKTHSRLHTEFKMKAIAACLRAHHENRELTVVRLHQESIEWLALTNPTLRQQIRDRIPRNR